MPCAHQPSTPCASTSQVAIRGWVHAVAPAASSSSCHAARGRPVAASSFSLDTSFSLLAIMVASLGSGAGDREEVVHRELFATLGGFDAGSLETSGCFGRAPQHARERLAQHLASLPECGVDEFEGREVLLLRAERFVAHRKADEDR